ncbi:hypothetical protein V1509DRAFT_631017 [Lipomyces kononenkoae]
MKSLREVFPTSINQLCRWHIQQNIMKNCRKYFSRVSDFDAFMQQVQKIASSIDRDSQDEELKQLRDKFPAQAVEYFFHQWWDNGVCECWADIYIRNHPNFGIATTSRVEGSHGAMKSALTSSSGTLQTATNKINSRSTESSRERSITGSNKDLFVRLDIRQQAETAALCTSISRFALEMIYAEVTKRLHHQEEEGAAEGCSCAIRGRYLLPCSHLIEPGQSIDLTSIHPRWRVHATLPPINVASEHIDPQMLSAIRDPPLAIPTKGRPNWNAETPNIRGGCPANSRPNREGQAMRVLSQSWAQSALVSETPATSARSRAGRHQRATMTMKVPLTMLTMTQTMLSLRECGLTCCH